MSGGGPRVTFVGRRDQQNTERILFVSPLIGSKQILARVSFATSVSTARRWQLLAWRAGGRASRGTGAIDTARARVPGSSRDTLARKLLLAAVALTGGPGAR